MATGQNNYSRRFLSMQERFLAFVKDQPAEGCWLWDGKISKDGYGVFSILGNKVRAHRAAWQIFRGELQSGMFVCHKCDVPRCVRPDHLFVGTPSDNVRDMHTKGRNQDVRGMNNPMRKLMPEHAAAIRESNEKGVVLAKRYQVSQATVSLIRHGLLWKQSL